MDIDASNWNEDDNANTTAAPDGAPEGMAPSGVNNVLRAIMGALKRRRNWGAPKTTAGTSTAYTLAYGVAPGALVDGMTHLVQFNAANGNAPTLNVNSLGAIPLHIYTPAGWAAAPAGVLTANMISRVAYHSSSAAYRVLDLNGAGTWTPADGSGAGLSFSSVTGHYRIANGMVLAYFALTFPSTGSSADVTISGLPVTVPNQDYARIDSLINAGSASTATLVLRPDKNAATVKIVNTSTGSNSPNSAWSGLTIKGCIVYPVT